ncbi:MAG: S9 family peptidase [Pyrinomonadaceae bacterium]
MRLFVNPSRCLLLLVVVLFSLTVYSQKNKPEAVQPYSAEELAHVESTYEARLLPGARGIVYVNDKSGVYELWHRPSEGAPEQLTTLKQQVTNPRLSPSGDSIIFGSDYGGNERYDLFRFDLKTKKTEALTQTKEISETQHRFSPDGKWLALEADPDIQFRPQIFVMELATAKRRQLTKGKVPAYRPVWSHDGKQIAATRTGDEQNGDLLIISVADGAVKEIKPPADGFIIWAIEFSPDSRQLLARTKNKQGFYQLALVDVSTGSSKRIGPEQWDVDEAVWSEKAGIFFTRNVSGRYSLWRMLTAEAAAEEVIAPRGVVRDLDISRDGARLSFIREDATQPAEIYLYTLATKQTEQLTRSLPKRIDPSRLSEAEPFKIKSFDGTQVEGFVYKPRADAVAQSARPLPAVAYIHGGPNGQSVEDFSPFVQALTQAGFVVVEPNYRGSTGYGKAYEDLNNKDWGGGDRKDVRAVLEHFIEQGLIDRDRIGITGGSYGGYMTLIALAKDPDFYRAGADSYGMFDLVEDYNLTKDRFGLWYETEMGTPETHAELFADRSAIRFLDRIKAPLIVFQGANDTNVPQHESDKMVEALKKMGRKVEYVVYADEGHGFTRRPNRIDNMQRTVSFFHEHLSTKNASGK